MNKKHSVLEKLEKLRIEKQDAEIEFSELEKNFNEYEE